jgi:hypothetical protein
MRDGEERYEFEKRQARLTDFLTGAKAPEDCNDPRWKPRLRMWHQARVMLTAPELLEACRYALTLLGGLASDDFAAGGDRPAREKLLHAISLATDGQFSSQALAHKCAADVREAIVVNQTFA